MTIEGLFRRLRDHLQKTARARGLADDAVRVSARALSPEEAIGNPEHDDYPLIIGRERMMEAEVAGVCGQAFTDMYGCWEGRVRDVWQMEGSNDFRRAIFVATLNAVMRFAGEVKDTVHCKNDGPVECARRLSSFTVVNGTIVHFLDRTLPTVFYGVTIAAPAVVLGLRRYCPVALEAH